MKLVQNFSKAIIYYIEIYNFSFGHFFIRIHSNNSNCWILKYKNLKQIFGIMNDVKWNRDLQLRFWSFSFLHLSSFE